MSVTTETLNSSNVQVRTQSPLEFFEQHAQAVWSSKLDPAEKAVKLYSVSDSIAKYLRKAQLELVSRSRAQDDWANLSCTRATMYLDQLSHDLRKLAVLCQNQAAASLKG